MATATAEAHIEAQAQLRALTVRGVAVAWDQLPNYDEASVQPFLSVAVPLVLAAQRQSAALTVAYLASVIARPPADVDVSLLVGAAIRNGTPPETVYRRPFVQTWSALRDHKSWEQAVTVGRERATGAAAMDVQNTMRHTLRAVGEETDVILGYRRVPDGDACPFCILIAGRRYLTSDLMEVHPRCGCGVDVITEANRGDFTGKRANDLAIPAGVAFHQHGELGPLVGSPDHNFAGPEVLAA